MIVDWRLVGVESAKSTAVLVACPKFENTILRSDRLSMRLSKVVFLLGHIRVSKLQARLRRVRRNVSATTTPRFSLVWITRTCFSTIAIPTTAKFLFIRAGH